MTVRKPTPSKTQHPALEGRRMLWWILVLTWILLPPANLDAGTHKLSRFNSGVFDLVLSLAWPPTTQDEADLEKGLNLFAQDVYRMTEGHHSLGTIYVYTPDPDTGKARYWSQADIIFRNGSADLADATVSGFLRSGGRIFIHDQVSKISSIGHSLAHELGHYAYGLFDEYADDQGPDPSFPNKGDTPKDTLMSYHLTDWQLSVPADYADPTQRKTAQYRMYEGSCWTVLIRDPKLDATQSRYSKYLKAEKPRREYSDLVALNAEPKLIRPTDYPKLEIVYNPDSSVLAAAEQSGRDLAGMAAQGAFMDTATLPVGLLKGPQIFLEDDSDSEFHLSVEITGGEYPEPILIQAMVHRDHFLKQINIVAYFTEPSGNDFELPLADDGESPDDVAGDGVYTGAAMDYENTTYPVVIKADNSAGTAMETSNGMYISPGGTRGEIPVDDPFELQVAGEIVCSGVVDDDHGKNFDTATLLPTDGTLEAGRLEEIGDTDYFYFFAVDGETYTVFTTELFPSSMKTQIGFFDSEKKSLAVSNETEFGDETDYMFIWKCPAEGFYYLTVSHTSSGQGVYHLNVRVTQPEDRDAGTSTTGGGGSGGGCFLSNLP